MPAAATAATTEIVVTVTWETFAGELRLGHGGQCPFTAGSNFNFHLRGYLVTK